MTREPKSFRFTDGSVRANRSDAPERKIAAIRHHEGMAEAALVARRTHDRLATEARAGLAALMRAAGTARVWSGGTLYTLNPDGRDVTAFGCPLASDLAPAQPAGDTAEEEARAGAMPGEPEPTDAEVDEAAAFAAIRDHLDAHELADEVLGRPCDLFAPDPGRPDGAHAATDVVTVGEAS